MTATEALPRVHHCAAADCPNLNDVPCFDDLLPAERHEAAYELCVPCLARYRDGDLDNGREEQD